jgi:hypothetical protein
MFRVLGIDWVAETERERERERNLIFCVATVYLRHHHNWGTYDASERACMFYEYLLQQTLAIFYLFCFVFCFLRS